MTRGIPGSEPAGHTGDCFYILAMYTDRDGTGRTAAELRSAIVRENTALSLPGPTLLQVRAGLLNLSHRRPPLAARDRDHPDARWTVTGHGRWMLAVWCGEDEPEPCGLGWPGRTL